MPAAFVVAAAMLACPLPARAQAAALVVDRIGEVSSAAPNLPQPVATLATLPVGSRIQLARGASLTVLYMPSGDEYTVTGPGDALVDSGGVSVSGGASVKRRALTAAPAPQLRSDSIAMGGFVARSGGLRARAPDGVLTAPPARLAWESLMTRAKYRVEIRDATGTLLFEQLTTGLTLAFPPDLQLRPDESYTWTVARQAVEGATPPAARAIFSLASPAVRDDARRRAPDASSSFADRLVYALWLEEIGALGEARDLWQALYEQRPDEQALLVRARR
ncbi:hypothetical protein QTI66_17235 [Variovorax sp. J22R133]|uniref:hypothetical protein n=1 Tax=Variovorax brevis TaxID=3053503 RepID=UPI002577699C|nr:hypothetical protein [Variovorax sp. J22R133]MDM0113904.1 hypothetical protein [Variovorax sp. J22R133]